MPPENGVNRYYIDLQYRFSEDEGNMMMGGVRNQLKSKPAWMCIVVPTIQENLDGKNTRSAREDRRCTLIHEDEVDNRVGCRCVILSNGSLPLLRIYFWCIEHLPSLSFV